MLYREFTQEILANKKTDYEENLKKSFVVSNNLLYVRHLLQQQKFLKRSRKYGKRKKWLKRCRVFRRWRFNRRSSKVWRKVRFLNNKNSRRRRFRVLKSFSIKKILLDFLAWKFQMSRSRIQFLVTKNFRRRRFSQDNVSNLMDNFLARWDNLLFWTQLVRNRKACQKLIRRKGLILNGYVVKDIFDLQRVAKVGDIVRVIYPKLYFRRLWFRRNKRIWPTVFEYSKRTRAWVLYRKLDFWFVAKRKPQVLRFLTNPLVVARLLGRLRF